MATNGLLYPTLLLIYSLIDSFSYIHSPNADQRAQFEDFVNTFVLPYGQIDCTATDLYAARNAVLHRLGTYSKLTDRQAAEAMSYCKGDADFSILQGTLEVVRERPGKRAPALKVEALAEAVRKGIEKLLDTANLDDNFKKRLEVYCANEQPFRFKG